MPKAALADVTIQFANNGAISSAPGTSVSINGTISNLATSSAIFINSVSGLSVIPSNNLATSSAYSITIDQSSSAMSYVPMTLNASSQYQGALVKLTISGNAAPGDYMGTYSLLGGNSNSSADVLATQYFILTVTGSSQSSNTNNQTTASSTNTTGGLQMPSGGLQYDDSWMSSDSGLAMNAEVGVYSAGPRLIKLEGTETVYWVSPNNLKIPMFSEAVFKSYKNNPEDVQTVSQAEFDYYQNAKYIRLIGNSRIYKTEGGAKRFIPSAVWNPAGIDPSLIIDINKTDFNSYKTGKAVAGAEELN